MRRRRLILLLLTGGVLLSGCWSSSPIEDLNVQVGIALDAADETGMEKEFEQKGGKYPKRNKMTCTYQFIVPEGSSGSTRDGTQSKIYYNMSETGNSIFETIRELSLRTNRNPVGHHLKIIVIGESLARSTNLSELIDFFTRDNDIRLSVLVLVSKGKASEVLSQALPNQIPSLVLKGIYNNRDRSSRIGEPLSLAKLIGPLHGKTSFILQNVIASGKEPKFAGAGVIKGKTGKLIGFLNESEVEGLIWLTGRGKGGVLKIHDPESDKLITYEIKTIGSKIKAKMKGDDISFEVKIESTGRYIEMFVPGGEPLDESRIKEDEKVLEKHVKEMVQKTVAKLQGEFHVDAAEFGRTLHIQHPDVWNKVNENWDETFSHTPITYEVKIDIKDYGASGTTIE
ncbi:Ger(x)C family spore germination protein [Paenibacillus wynnii]|uniref:Ger(x)C family spore germination protein n=1 Tax=Paenibacillus wynnii TaxID=268407 RepID=UPI00279501A4|nr:Ger(x)C family spore germination protein [Paenibacillus wynnii]MDQ0195168.1 spore germination protein [Paenibacillus wynnii]